MHFTHLRRRILKIKPSVASVNIDDDDNPITLIVDASGLTIAKKGDYIRTKMDKEEKRICQAAYCSGC